MSERTRWGLLLGGIGLFGLLTRSGIAMLVPDGQLNDDACFLLRALHFAQPQEVAGLPNPIHYAPGWPLLLSLFVGWSANWYAAGRVLATGLTCATACLLGWGFARRTGSLGSGFAVALLFLNAPQVMILGSSLMAEPLYFFLLTLCLLAAPRVQGHGGAVLLGLLAGWCFLTRTEGLVLVGALGVSLVAQKRARKTFGSYLAGFVAIGVGLRTALPQPPENAHVMVARGVLGSEQFPTLWSYTKVLLEQGSNTALQAVFDRSGPGYHLLWLIPLWSLLALFRAHGWKTVLGRAAQEPMVVWLAAFPLVFYAWPFFNPRYWPLWAVLLFALSLAHLFKNRAWLPLAGLLLLQLPGAWHWYQTGPLAQRFQEEIYLPYYRGMSVAKKVLTLNNTRVSTIAKVPTVQPLQNSDFQSLPIAMAHTGADLIEWETAQRTLLSVTGSDARLYPPQALAGLRQSSLFRLELSCDFSECYRLLADPEKLKQAGAYYSYAGQAKDPAVRLELLQKAAALVSDLPEVELALCQERLRADPGNAQAREALTALLKRYPFLQAIPQAGGKPAG